MTGDAEPPTTSGHLLGGRVRYVQPRLVFRSGIEPVLLAASIPARPRDTVLEAGTGAGAALLCLSARVRDVAAIGVEADDAMARQAAENASANGFSGISIVSGRIEYAALAGPFDHVLANPPYHPADGTQSALPSRDLAKRGSVGLIAEWIARMSGLLRRRGTMTLIVPSGLVPACLAAMGAEDSPCSAIFPLWPKAGRPAKLVLLRGIRQGRTPMSLMQGLVLHQADGRFTEAAQAVLKDGTGLDIDG